MSITPLPHHPITPAASAPTADLHLHTFFSDGSWAPADLARASAERGLRAIAVTDHDTLDGVAPTQEAGAACGIDVIAGVEITARIGTAEVHILGYFFDDRWQSSALPAVLAHAGKIRSERAREFVGRLNALGYPVTFEEVVEAAGPRPDDGAGGVLGRMHVALALVRRGAVDSVEEAFDRFLKAGRAAHVDRYRMTAAEAIGHVRRAGGIAALAHPGISSVRHRLRELVDQGLEGLEVWHPKHSPSQTAHYLEKARDLGLLATGGSDCHGTMYGPPGLGTVAVPFECVAALRDRAAHPPITLLPPVCTTS